MGSFVNEWELLGRRKRGGVEEMLDRSFWLEDGCTVGAKIKGFFEF